MKAQHLFVIGALASSLVANTPPKPTRPNILFIMSDDHATQAISAYGSRVNTTPNLDRLAQEGVRFDRVFATNAICTPSRASILTGHYSHVNGVTAFNPLDPARDTAAKRLQQAGYYTAMVGKWHLGSDPQGFDHWEIFPGQGAYLNPVLYTASGRKTYTGYATDLVTDLALEVLERRPQDKPFFLMLHHKAPHRNWIPTEAAKARWAGRVVPEPPTLFDDYATRTDAIREQEMSVARHLTRNDLKEDPPPGLTGDDLTRWKYQRYLRDYLACVDSVDENVGRVLRYLDAHGLSENTLVIYTSDQGFFLGEHGLYDKRLMYEASIRMPFLARWPGVIRPGSVQDALGINCDFAPTFLEVAGQSAPATMQGRSLVPLLKGRKPAKWRSSVYYRYYDHPGEHNVQAHLGVRTATHKLIHFWKKDQWECYDLVKDPQELHNLYSDPKSQPLVALLKRELKRLQHSLGDATPVTPSSPAGAPCVPSK